MNIGEQINNLRKQHGLSQDDFANLFNVSRQTISNWENGKSYPDLEMIIKVSDYFKISIDELLKNDKYNVSNAIKLINGNIGQNNNIYTIPLYMSFLIGGQE